MLGRWVLSLITAWMVTPDGAPISRTPERAAPDSLPPLEYEGWRQYSVHCARCHAQDVLNSNVAPWLVMSLKPDGPVPTKEEFIHVVRDGRRSKGMPGFEADYLEEDKLEAIYAYVKGRSDGVIQPGRPVRRSEP